MLKVWGDVVQEGLGDKPFTPEDILKERSAADFEPEAIGYLTRPVQMEEWIALVRNRFSFLSQLDEDQLEISRCSKGEEWLVGQRIGVLRGA